MIPYKSYLLTALVGAGIGALIAVKARPLPPPLVVEKIVQGKRETITVDRIVEKVVKPDGTVTERTTEKERTARVETRKEAPKVVLVPKTSYSLDLRYLPALYAPPSWRDMEVTGAARIGQSDWWVTAGYDIKHNQFTLGVRYEW